MTKTSDMSRSNPKFGSSPASMNSSISAGLSSLNSIWIVRCIGPPTVPVHSTGYPLTEQMSDVVEELFAGLGPKLAAPVSQPGCNVIR